MFIVEVISKGKNGKSYTSILLRKSVRAGSKVKSKTLAVLTHLPPHVLAAVRRAIAQQPGIKQALGVTDQAALSYWQVLARVLRPGISLLGMVRLAGSCAAAALLGWRRTFTEDDLYANGTWLEGRHDLIERRLWEAGPPRPQEQLFLYDVTSSYLEGDCNALAAWGYNRDHKQGKKQVVVGLLTDSQGEPVSVQVYRGNTSDLKTFDQQVHEVILEDGRRFVLRCNPIRQAQMRQSREQKQRALEEAVRKANKYLEDHPRAKVETQRKQLAARLASLNVQDWLKLTVNQRQLVLSLDAQALQAAAQTVHDRYKDLARVERDFRTLKTGHMEFRPWFVCTEDNTQVHALTAMMALKVRRYLERAWRPLEVTVEEGLRELEQLSIMELVHSESGKVVARQMPEPNVRQKQLLEALGLTLPSKVPEAKVTVVTRKKIQHVRKTLVK
jgi:hypothetical protein